MLENLVLADVYHHIPYKEYYVNKDKRGITMACQDYALWIVQSYWVIWLVGSFVASIILGGIIFRNYEMAK